MKYLNELIGKKIVRIRPISKKELDAEGWDDCHSATAVIELENGIKIYPSRDDEGNGPGTLFGKDENGKDFYVWDKDVIDVPK